MKRRLRQTPKGFASTNATFEVDCIGRVTLMATEQKQELRLAIAHVLFVDIVGYSKLLTEEQSEALQRLNELVRAALAFREAEAANQLISLPTGDGIALIFTSTAEAPVECALQLSEALAAYPEIKVRMGVHSGPVHEVPDVNQRANVAGACPLGKQPVPPMKSVRLPLWNRMLFNVIAVVPVFVSHTVLTRPKVPTR